MCSKSSTSVSEGDSIRKEEKKPSKKTSNEIDEIFAGKKRKKTDDGKPGKKPGRVAAAAAAKLDDNNETTKENRNKQRKNNGSKNSARFEVNFNNENPPSRPRKRTGDGLAIYTEEELGIGKRDGGGTPLCPFDCDCCF